MMTDKEREHQRLAERFASANLDVVQVRHRVAQLETLVQQTEAAGNADRAQDYRDVLRKAQSDLKRLEAEAHTANGALAANRAKG